MDIQLFVCRFDISFMSRMCSTWNLSPLNGVESKEIYLLLAALLRECNGVVNSVDSIHVF